MLSFAGGMHLESSVYLSLEILYTQCIFRFQSLALDFAFQVDLLVQLSGGHCDLYFICNPLSSVRHTKHFLGKKKQPGILLVS